MKLSNFHKVDANTEVKTAMSVIADDLRKIASKESLTDEQKNKINDALAIVTQASNNIGKMDTEGVRNCMARCAKLVEAAFEESILPIEFREKVKEKALSYVKPLEFRGLEGKVLLSNHPESNGFYKQEKTVSPIDPTRVAELVLRDLSHKYYGSAQEAFDGYCQDNGPWPYASAIQKVKLATLLQNAGFVINAGKYESEATSDEKAHKAKEEERKSFEEKDNKNSKKAKLIVSQDDGVLSDYQHSMNEGTDPAYYKKQDELLKQYRGSIKPGDVFDTSFEKGCVAQGSPDADGNFDGLDSDHVEVQFNTNMIRKIYPKSPLTSSKKLVLSIYQSAAGTTNAYCSCGGQGSSGGTTKHTISEGGVLTCNKCGSVKNPTKPVKKAGIGGLADAPTITNLPDTSNSTVLDRIADKVKAWWSTTKQPVDESKVVQLASEVDPNAGNDSKTLMTFLSDKLGKGIINTTEGETVDYKNRPPDNFMNASKKTASMYCESCKYTAADMLKTSSEDNCPQCGGKMVIGNSSVDGLPFSSSAPTVDNNRSILDNDRYQPTQTHSTQNQLGATAQTEGYNFAPYDILWIWSDKELKWEQYYSIKTPQEGQQAKEMVDNSNGTIKYQITDDMKNPKYPLTDYSNDDSTIDLQGRP